MSFTSRKILAGALGIATVLSLVGTAAVLTASASTTSSYSYTRNLTVGSQGTDVSALQQFLSQEGFFTVAPTGYFGPITKKAVMAWQASVGLPSTGFFGPMSRTAIASSVTTTTTTTTTSSTPGCPAGAMFNSMTGAPCTTTTTSSVPGCSAGALFSSTTGESCATTSTTVTSVATNCPVGYTCTANNTPASNGQGVAGTLTISNSGSVANGATFNTGQSVNIAGFQLQAGPSDMTVNTLTFDFNVRPWLFFSTFSVVNQTTGAVLVPATPISANSFTQLTASEDYRYTIGGLNFVVPHGQTVNIVLNGQALSGISQATGTYVSIIAATVRSVDGTGVVDTESLPLLSLPQTGSTQYGSVLYNGNQTANLVATIDPSSPSAQVIQTQTGAVTDNVPLAVFDVQAQNNSATLQGLTVNLSMATSSGYDLANVINTVELVTTSGTYYGNLTPNATDADIGTVTFNSNVNVPLPLGTNVPLKIVANINQGVTGVNLTASLVTPSTQGISPNFIGVDANYNTPTVAASGTITGATVSFSTNAAVQVTPGSVGTPTYTATTQSNKSGNYAVTWPFTFTVAAGTSPIYVSATPSKAVVLATDLSGTPGVSGNASSTIPTSISGGAFLQGDTNTGLGANATGSFYVPSNSSRTFTVNAIINNFGNANPDNSAQVQIAGVYYSSSPTAAGQTTNTANESIYNSNLTSLQSTPTSLLTQ